MHQVVILVEGASDRRALEEVARLRGDDLTGITVLAMSGITNLARHLLAVPHDVRVTGLYDVAEQAYVRATLRRLGRKEPFWPVTGTSRMSLFAPSARTASWTSSRRSATGDDGTSSATSRSTATGRGSRSCAGSSARPVGAS